MLVACPYPPAPDPQARAAMATVAGALRDGHEVRVLSPEPGAAHEHGPLAGVAGAWSLLRRARSYDALVVHVAPGMLLSAAGGRAGRLAACAAFDAAFARFGHVTVHVDDLRSLHGSVGGRSGRRLWHHVTRAVVGDEHDRLLLHEHGGVALDRIDVFARQERGSDSVNGGGGVADGPRLVAVAADGPARWRSGTLTAEEAMAEIRARGATRRAAAGPAIARDARTAALAPPQPGPVPGVASILARRAAKRALGRYASSVSSAARRLRARVAGPRS